MINRKYLETNILKLNYKSFTQIVVLGSSSFIPFMQLSAPNRREVIEDLLDIRIFSAMNSVVKDKLRHLRDNIKILELRKESLTDKVNMQKKFIEEIESRGKKNIKEKVKKKDGFGDEIITLTTQNESLNDSVSGLNEEQEKVTGASKTLLKLNNLKGKMSNKVSTLTKEHKFFTDNVTCPTCTQNIEESFRLNRIAEVETKAKELQDGYKELQFKIKSEQERELQFNTLSKEITKLNNDISQNNTKISGFQRQISDLESEIQTLTDQLANRNTEHEKLTELREQLNTTFDELVEKKEELSYKDYVYNLLKDGGVKTKIIKKYLPLINKQVNRYLQMMDFYINFKLNEEFSETVESPIHEDFSYASFLKERR